MNPFAFLKPPPERVTNLRLILAELDAANARADRLKNDMARAVQRGEYIAENPAPWDGTERRASERVGDSHE